MEKEEKHTPHQSQEEERPQVSSVGACEGERGRDLARKAPSSVSGG